MPCQYQFEGYPVDVGHGSGGCQFHVPESSLVTIDNGKWCPFHQPLYDKSGLPTPKKSWHNQDLIRFNEEVFDYINYSYKQPGPIDLTGVVFPGEVDFQTIFTKERPFRHILFGGADFLGSVDFQKCHFPWWLRFDGAIFRSEILFLSSSFKFVSFESARFLGEAIFLWANFQDFADYKRASFEGNVIFEGAITGEKGRDFFDVTFEGAIFSGRVNFNNRRFLNTVDFSLSRFSLAPEFYGCRLHQDSRFTNTIFDDISTPHAPAAYRALKVAMEQVHAHDLQSLFYTLESQSVSRQPETTQLNRSIANAYRFTSNFGQSVFRPFVGMVVVMGLFFFGNQFVCNRFGLEVVNVEILQFTIEQVIHPFAVWSKKYLSYSFDWVTLSIESYPIFSRLIISFYSIIFYINFSLLLLGLSRRLRM